MKTALLYTLLAAALALATVAAHAKGSRGAGKADYRGYPGARAIDGDTFRYRGERYRLRQYDAPELGSPGADAATQRLQRKLDAGSHEWRPVARDAYGRVIVDERRRR